MALFIGKRVMDLPSAYWYYGLVIISLILLAVSLACKKDFRLLVLHLALAGITHPFEIMVLFILVGYRYLPGVLPEPVYDNGLGAFVSDLFIVPASAVAINAFSLGWSAIAGIAVAFTATDWFYARIGIYQHLWWKPVYTGGALLVYYAISRWLWHRLQESRPILWFRLLVIYLIYSIIHSAANLTAVAFLHLYRFQFPWLEGAARNHPANHTPFLYLVSVIITLCIGLPMSFRYRLAGFVLIAMIYWALDVFQFVVPLADISAFHLVLIPTLVVPILLILFRAAKLDYLFP